MKLLIVPDKFKGTLSSEGAAEVICRAIKHLRPTDVECKKIAIADGGDGSLALLGAGMPIVTCSAHDALGRARECRYAFDGERAVVESAEVIGLAMLAEEERSPLTASSYGLGEVIAHALRRGAKRIDVALGGVATSDCGVGMLRALGTIFRNSHQQIITPSIVDYQKIDSIDINNLLNNIRGVDFRALCDVRNPLLGPEGAAATYAPQKGATPAEVALIEQFATHLVEISRSATHLNSGSGAAGGLGWALMEFLGAQIVSGAEEIARLSGLEEAVAEADLVITGEGRIDSQSEQGKVVGHICALCERYSKPCVLYCGEALTPIADCYALTDHYTREEALSNAESLLFSLVTQTIEPYLLK
ncbi:MAG: glycerate kinase [Tidjanibacter sp.]|nr:glycerate kinase [Tidjanibacter sp.]